MRRPPLPPDPRRLASTAARTLRCAHTMRRTGVLAAARFPHAQAVCDEAGVVSFRELHQRTNALAHALAADGVGAGDAVAILCRSHT